MTLVTIPYRPAGTEVRSISGLLSDFDAITGVVNGNLDGSNVANGSITDAKLTSPSNQLYKSTGLDGYFNIPSGVAGGPEMFGGFLMYLNPTDFLVAGKTLKQQITASASWYSATSTITVILRRTNGLNVSGGVTWNGTNYGQVIMSLSGGPSITNNKSTEDNFVAAGIYGLSVLWTGTLTNNVLVAANLNYKNL